MLYIIVPVYNRIEKTIEFINSLICQKYKNFRLLIVNDGSTDGTREYIEINYPEVIIIDGDGSLFWGGAINKGLEYVNKIGNKNDFIAFANNDITFTQNTIIDLVHKADSAKELALFHSLVISKNGRCFTSGSKILSWPMFWTKHPYRGLFQEEVFYKKKIIVDLATARFILFKIEVLNFVPFIDTYNFKHYLGDCDFSLRLKSKNIMTYIVPSSYCIIDNNSTGENAGNIKSYKQFFRSLTSIKSSNNLNLRYRFGKIHCPLVYFPFYCVAVTLQVFIINLIIQKSNN